MHTNKESAGPATAERLRGWLAGRLPGDWFEEPAEIVVDREEITIIGRLASPDTAATADTAATTGKPAAGVGAAGAGADAGGPAGTGSSGGTGNGTAAAAAAGGEAAGEAGGEQAGGEQAGGEQAATGTHTEAAAAVLGRARRFREETRDARIEIARELEHMFGRKVSWGVICGGRKVMFTTLSVPVMTRLRQSERRVLDTLVDAGVARSRSDALAWCVRLVGEHEDSWLGELRDALRRVEAVRAAGPQA